MTDPDTRMAEAVQGQMEADLQVVEGLPIGGGEWHRAYQGREVLWLPIGVVRKAIANAIRARREQCPTCDGFRDEPGTITRGELSYPCVDWFHPCNPRDDMPASLWFADVFLRAVRDNPDHDQFCLRCNQSFKQELGHPCSTSDPEQRLGRDMTDSTDAPG